MAQEADSIANSGNAKGYLTLFIMATKENGEAAEYAIGCLHILLYTNTESWIKSLSQIDSVKLTRFIHRSCVAIIGMNEDEEKYAPHFKMRVQKKLKTMQCNNSESRLRDIIRKELERKYTEP